MHETLQMDTTVVSAERTIGALFSAVTDALVAGEASIVITTPQMTATITKRKTGQWRALFCQWRTLFCQWRTLFCQWRALFCQWRTLFYYSRGGLFAVIPATCALLYLNDAFLFIIM